MATNATATAAQQETAMAMTREVALKTDTAPTATSTTETSTAEPLITPSPTPTPLPTVMVEAEWPQRMELNENVDTVRITLVRTAEEFFVPTVQVTDREHAAEAATPIPVGTPGVPLAEARGPQYSACAVAHLDPVEFETGTQATTECLSLDTPRLTWEWGIVPAQEGEQFVIASIEIHWTSAEKDAPPIPPTQIWHRRLNITVESFAVKTGRLSLMSSASLAASPFFFGLWLFRELKRRRRRRYNARLLEKAFGVGYALEDLRRTVTEHFDIEELRTLCFDLRVDYDRLRGEGKEGKVRELITFIARRGRLEDLITVLRKARPDLFDGK